MIIPAILLDIMLFIYHHVVSRVFKIEFDKRSDCGLWPIFRYNPELENPMKLDYKGPKIPVKEYMYNETRFKMVEKMNAEAAA